MNERIASPQTLFPSPLVGEGGECGAIASTSRARGSDSRATLTPHPSSLGFASARAPSATRGEGKEFA
jgi:hypothetical protein